MQRKLVLLHLEIPNEQPPLQAEAEQQQHQSPQRRRMPPNADSSSSGSGLPVVNPHPTSATPPIHGGGRGAFSLRSHVNKFRWVHALPLLLLLVFFLLWWFSSPVNVVVKDGRIMQLPSNFFQNGSDNLLDFDWGRLTILAVSTSPKPSLEPTLAINNDP